MNGGIAFEEIDPCVCVCESESILIELAELSSVEVSSVVAIAVAGHVDVRRIHHWRMHHDGRGNHRDHLRSNHMDGRHGDHTRGHWVAIGGSRDITGRIVSHC